MKLCIVCGKEPAQRKYCIACGLAVRKQNLKVERKRWYAKQREKAIAEKAKEEEAAQRKYPKLTISQVSKLARNCGVTYGIMSGMLEGRISEIRL